VQAPTLDREEIRGTIDRFQLQRGTNIGGAILVSLQTLFPEAEFDVGPRFTSPSRRGAPLGELAPREEDEFFPVEPGSYESAAVVLLTDGVQTTGPDPIQVARMAADRGVRVFTVGFGSPDGEIVGWRGYRMRVQLDEETLRQIAEVTRGRYFHAATASDLSEVYQSLNSVFVMETEETEITAFYSAAAGLMMLLAGALSLLWFHRII
jgi:Ca-activated chloride channel homolog